MSDRFVAIVLPAITLLAGWALGFGMVQDYWRAETVERGLAIYCPQNGQWAWIGECGDE